MRNCPEIIENAGYLGWLKMFFQVTKEKKRGGEVQGEPVKEATGAQSYWEINLCMTFRVLHLAIELK